MSPSLNLRTAGLAAALAFSSCVPAVLALPVISEIMYRPGTGYPEVTALEYVEVHNPDAAPVDLSGWAFRSGVNFTFPPGTIIPPGEFVVVASSPSALQAVFGSVNALGPWQAGNSLSNNGEKITLSMPGTAPGTWTKVDEVSYASEGDWATRSRDAQGGWDWTTPANGGGKSLELRNPALSNDNGQNWTASTATSGGTPGAVNTASTSNLPPVIHSVKHSPAIPTTTQSVTISCDVNDEASPEARAATLFYRNAATTSPPGFTSIAMTNDGTGKFRTVLAPVPVDKTIIEFYISSSDGTTTRTWPAATTEGQNANCQYQVDNEVPATTADTYRLTMTAAENAAYTGLAAGNPNSDRQFNLTLIVLRDSETSIRYRSSMRIRGNSSRSYQFKPLRISIPNDDGLDGSTSFNLNPKAPFLQYLGMKCFQAAGLPAANVIPVDLRRNGVKDSTSGGSTPDYGRWVRMEDLGGEMVDYHWPLANSGNIYKKGRPDRFWRSTASAPSTPAGLLDGWTKQNNSTANDWTDLTGFFQTWQSTAAPHFPGAPAGDVAQGTWDGTPFSPDDMDSIGTVADTSQWARWFALMTLLEDNETNISNGEDDDYACYFVPGTGGQRRMQLLPHDLDTVFGKGDSPLGPTDRGLYDSTGQGSAFVSLYPLMGTSSTAGNADFRTRYHNAIREMCGTLFSSANFPAFVEYHLGNWAPANIRTDIATFMSSRSTYLLGQIGSGATTPPDATATASLTQSHGTLMISEVLAANAAAYPRDGVFPDVIELYNAGGAAVDLGGKSLTDDPALPLKFVFAPGTLLNPGAFLLLVADSNFAGAGLHTGFSLDQSGDGVYLFDSAGTGGALLDSLVFGPQATDFSIGRTGAGLNTVTLCTPTPGAANAAVVSLGAPGSLRINEWLTNHDFRVNDDFIEIHNSGPQPVAMGGLRMTDDFANYPSKHVLPVLSFIGPGGFHVFKARGGNATPDNPAELPFSLDSTFGGAALLGVNGTIVDQVMTVSQRRDKSTGRSPDSGATLTSYDVPSPGLANNSLPSSHASLLNSLRISEFIYKPTGGNDYEFVELQNTGAVSLSLAGVRFTSGVDYTFPAGVTLAPGGFIVVCRNRAAFLSRFPNAAPVLAPDQFTGALDNSGETLTLSLPNPWDVAIVNFRYETTWEPLTFSAGYSLTALDPAVTPARDYNERESWTASPVAGGTPGSNGPPGITSPLVASSIMGGSFTYTITASRSPLSYSATPLPAGLTLNSSSGLISGTPTVSGVFNISIGATNISGTDTRTLVLTIVSSGPLDHFTWDYPPLSAEAGIPFPAVLTARDAQERLVTSFSSTIPLKATAVSGGSSTSSVYITEVTDEVEDQFELQNTGTSTVNTAGWYVIVGNSAAINSPQTTTWALPGTVPPGGILRVSELNNNQPGVSYFGSSISWTQLLSRGWIMLVDNGGTVHDFFVWGWTATEMADVVITVNGKQFSLPANWTGNGIPIPAGRVANSLNSFQRYGASDTNTADDWFFSTGSASWGVSNTSLNLPWQGALAITLTPATAAFSSGTFAGFLTIAETATAVRLSADDGASHTAETSPFDVTAPAPDADNDKIPDAWETAHGFNPSSAADATTDADGDGFNNRTEYYAGTDPRSAVSKLAVTAWSMPSPSQVSLSWAAQPNRLYRIRYSTGLNAWSYIPGQVYMPDTAGPRTATFAPPANAFPRAYYQVELLTPP